MWMNDYDIDDMVDIAQRDLPEILPFARYLAEWRDTVNANTDGWASWRAGTACADRLMALLTQAKDAIRRGEEPPPRELFVKSLSSIKRLANKKGLPHPELEEVPVAVRATPRGPRI